ncbi:MAG: SIMPL domain-containing protein [Candidatus Roizmanbacteria bacterium]
MKNLYLVAVPVTAVLTLFVVRMFGLGIPLQVTQQPTSEFSVMGEGKVEVVPDIAYVDVGVTADGVTAEDAQTAISKVNNSIVAKMAEYAIEKKDIETQNFNVYPNYDYNNGNRIIGYRGNTVLNIKVKDTKMIGDIAKAATQAGATEIQNTRFVVQSPEKYREQARDKAIVNAREQATKLSNQLGIKLGRVVNMIESSGANTIPYYAAQANMGGGGGTANLQPGSQEIISDVTLYFEKK